MAGTAGSNKDIQEIKAMVEKLAQRDDCIGDFQQIQAKMTEQVATIVKAVEKITLTVYGNGKPGLTTIVEILTKWMEDHEKSRDKPNIWVESAIRAAVTLVVGAIFGLILVKSGVH